MNNAEVDDDDWPHPRVVGNTFGLDTIAHGVLTAIRLPGPYVLQSARYERRRRKGRGNSRDRRCISSCNRLQLAEFCSVWTLEVVAARDGQRDDSATRFCSVR